MGCYYCGSWTCWYCWYEFWLCVTSHESAFADYDNIVASRLAEGGLKTLLLEAGGASYGITGGDLDARRPVSIYHV